MPSGITVSWMLSFLSRQRARAGPGCPWRSGATARKLRDLDDNDVDGLLRLLLGEQQFARFEQHDVTMQDIAAILEAYGKETGLGLGED